jgi:methyl-accepting chemotaxis protein
MLRKIQSILNNLTLAKKLTLLLLVIFIGGISFSGIALASILNYKAQNEITSRATLLLQTLSSVRSYTSTEVSPALRARIKKDEFLPQSIPSYSSARVFEKLKKEDSYYSDFGYKPAMLDPTNLQDKADNFETELVQKFRSDKNLKELSGFRSLGNQDFFYISQPISISDSTCLKCHSTPDLAPKEMIKKYGTKNGFNWQLNEVLGTQIVSVPASQVFQNARQSFVLVMGIVVIIFTLTILLANLWLKRYIVRPIKQIVRVAEAVSTGDMDAEFEKVSNDEVGNLVEAFTRMKLSLAMAITRFEQYRIGSRKPKDSSS